MRTSFRNIFVGWLTAAFLLVGLPAHAGMIGTESIVAAQSRDSSLNTANAFIARADVQQQLRTWGVEPSLAAERVARLSDEELQRLAQTIDSQPVGADGGFFVVVGVVFVVLIILELVGVTHIFRKF